MDLESFKLESLGISREKFRRILAIVDFGNVTYWYFKDVIGPDAAPLKNNQRLIVDLKKLFSFISTFAYQARFYYGWHPRLSNSQHILIKADKIGFIKKTKQIQYIKHYLSAEEQVKDGVLVQSDARGSFIKILKCNFDVEITIDALRLAKDYDTLCLFSGDSDFARLAQFIKKRGKKVIVIASGRIYHELKKSADLYINAQQVKAHIVSIKQTTPPRGDVV